MNEDQIGRAAEIAISKHKEGKPTAREIWHEYRRLYPGDVASEQSILMDAQGTRRVYDWMRASVNLDESNDAAPMEQFGLPGLDLPKFSVARRKDGKKGMTKSKMLRDEDFSYNILERAKLRQRIASREADLRTKQEYLRQDSLFAAGLASTEDAALRLKVTQKEPA